MRKTKLLFFLCSLFAVGAVMAEETTDKVVISELELAPGGDQAYFTVSLEGSQLYSAYDICLVIPEGLEVVYKNDVPYVQMFKGASGVYPSVTEEDPFEGTSTTTYTHTIASNVIDGNVLRVMCYSTASEDFTANSGRLFGVFVKATPYAKPGAFEIAVKNVYLTTSAAVQYEPADYVSTSVKAGTTSTLTLKVSGDYKFGTCILPFDYELPTDGSLEAYTSSSATTDALLLTKADKIEAYTPYILYSEAGFSQTISGTVNPDNYPAEGIVKQGCLVGTVVNKQLAEATSYVLQNQDAGTMFYQVDPELPFSLPAGKCYAQLPEGTAASALRIGETTGIEHLEFNIQNSESIFNLLGQPVKTMQPGHIYIVNGRKVVIE